MEAHKYTHDEKLVCQRHRNVRKHDIDKGLPRIRRGFWDLGIITCANIQTHLQETDVNVADVC